ncbi:hypothetical protein PV963_29650 [Streptomyces coeruleorubidus]|uniref:DUF6542 domain-containing protein n=1 Tax=Streptomyces coeruleorubidus TaxID=116188 RepID=UPI00237FA83D|nr:DUF6542 domain-containing protein [Streptomyces coeruleorubidus]WDV54227.1 hypothetical protein PV963_29650 [Streptomyces coeruleorubidus]
MEQYRTRPAQYGPRRDRPRSSLPPQAGRGASGGAVRAVRQPGPQRRPAAVRRPAPAPAPAAARMPNPRLTGLGSGLFCALVMFLLGGLCAVLFGASLTAYGVLFLPVCVLTAVWVRRGDLMTAPVVVPIAFAVGLLPVADGDGGTDGQLMGLVTALATQAGWLYGGTLIAGLIVIARRIRLVRRRRAVAGARPPV